MKKNDSNTVKMRLESFRKNILPTSPYYIIDCILLLTKNDVNLTQKLCSIIEEEKPHIPEHPKEQKEWINHLFKTQIVASLDDFQDLQESQNSVTSLSNNNKSNKLNRKRYRQIIKWLIASVMILGLGYAGYSGTKSDSSLSEDEPNVPSCYSELKPEAEELSKTFDRNRIDIIIKEMKNCVETIDSSIDQSKIEEFRNLLYELQFNYARITAEDFETMEDIYTASKILCQIPEEYLKKKGVVPYFARWSNTYEKSEYKKWLETYKASTSNGCPSFSYLNNDV